MNFEYYLKTNYKKTRRPYHKIALLHQPLSHHENVLHHAGLVLLQLLTGNRVLDSAKVFLFNKGVTLVKDVKRQIIGGALQPRRVTLRNRMNDVDAVCADNYSLLKIINCKVCRLPTTVNFTFASQQYWTGLKSENGKKH